MLCLNCEEDCLEPGLLDGWVEIDAFVEGECFEEAQATWPHECAGVAVEELDALVHSFDVDVHVGIVQDSVSMFPHAMEERPCSFYEGGLECLGGKCLRCQLGFVVVSALGFSPMR